MQVIFGNLRSLTETLPDLSTTFESRESFESPRVIFENLRQSSKLVVRLRFIFGKLGSCSLRKTFMDLLS